MWAGSASPAGLAAGGASAVVVAACALLGMVIERFGCARWKARRAIAPLLATIGIGFILDQVAQLIFGPSRSRFRSRCRTGGSGRRRHDRRAGSADRRDRHQLRRALMGFLRFQPLGWAVRATAQDRDAAQQMGVDVNRVNRSSSLRLGAGRYRGRAGGHVLQQRLSDHGLPGRAERLCGRAARRSGKCAGRDRRRPAARPDRKLRRALFGSTTAICSRL